MLRGVQPVREGTDPALLIERVLQQVLVLVHLACVYTVRELWPFLVALVVSLLQSQTRFGLQALVIERVQSAAGAGPRTPCLRTVYSVYSTLRTVYTYSVYAYKCITYITYAGKVYEDQHLHYIVYTMIVLVLVHLACVRAMDQK